MDNAQLGFLAGVLIAVNGSVSALMVAMVNRSKKPYNGEERRGDGNDQFAQHIVSCPHVKMFTTGIERIETRLGGIEQILMGRK